MSKRGDYDVHMNWSMLILLSVIMFLAGRGCKAQDNRWRIMVERDTLAVLPIDDLRTAWAYRITKNEQVRICARLLAVAEKDAANLRIAVEAGKEDRRSSNALLRLRVDERDAARADVSKLRTKLRRRNPMVYLLLGATGGVLINNAVR